MAISEDSGDDLEVLARLRARVQLPGPVARFQVTAPVARPPHLDRFDREISSIDPDYRLAQVKEKFGRLCFDLDSAGHTEQERARIADLVCDAERASYGWT